MLNCLIKAWISFLKYRNFGFILNASSFSSFVSFSLKLCENFFYFSYKKLETPRQEKLSSSIDYGILANYMKSRHCDIEEKKMFFFWTILCTYAFDANFVALKFLVILRTFRRLNFLKQKVTFSVSSRKPCSLSFYTFSNKLWTHCKDTNFQKSNISKTE